MIATAIPSSVITIIKYIHGVNIPANSFLKSIFMKKQNHTTSQVCVTVQKECSIS